MQSRFFLHGQAAPAIMVPGPDEMYKPGKAGIKPGQAAFQDLPDQNARRQEQPVRHGWRRGVTSGAGWSFFPGLSGN